MEKVPWENNHNKVSSKKPYMIGVVKDAQKLASLSTDDLMRVFANLMIDRILENKQVRLKLQVGVSNI